MENTNLNTFVGVTDKDGLNFLAALAGMDEGETGTLLRRLQNFHENKWGSWVQSAERNDVSHCKRICCGEGGYAVGSCHEKGIHG